MSAPEHHPFVLLALGAIRDYVLERQRFKYAGELPPEMQERCGVFVSLHKGGELRGCIGTITPQRRNLAEEIIDNAISAAARDPRFAPVGPEELSQLEISVDVLTKPELIESIADQNPKVHGLIVQSKRNVSKRGLLLPDLDAIDTPEKQLYYTRVLKAGITDPDEPVELYRFEVRRYH